MAYKRVSAEERELIYRFPGFRPAPTVVGIFGDPKARVIRLQRRGKKRRAEPAGSSIIPGTTGRYAVFATCPVGTCESTWSWRSVESTAGVAAR